MIRIIASSLMALTLLPSTQAFQDATKTQLENTLPPCYPDQAIDLVQAQADEAGNIDNLAARISVMTRAAGALWKFQQDRARAIFAQAYETAEKDFQEQSDSTDKQAQRTSSRGDQRFTVIQAISKYDPVWSRQLAKTAAEQTRREAERRKESAGISSASLSDISGRLLSLASSMLEVDKQSAVDLARNSLRYPASLALTQFLFKLAASDQAAADQLYQGAVNEYANSSLRHLLLLSAYPFASNRIVVGVQSITVAVPSNFVPNPGLQRLFLASLFRRAEASLNTLGQPAATPDQASEPTEIYIALNILEPQIAQHQPALIEKAGTLKVAVANNLYPEVRQQANATVSRQLGTEDDSFTSYVERAERVVGSSQRDQYLAFAVLKAPEDESLDRLSSLAKRVSDSKTSQQLLSWLYFKRSQMAIKGGLLDDAKELADKVEQIELRAYLSYEIAAEALKRFEDRGRAREVLDGVAATALKLDNTNEKARTLLGISHLYAKLDYMRAFEIMKDAVKTINNIASPDFSSTGIFQRIEGQHFGYNARYAMAGFSLENTFRELAPFDFQTALWQAKSLEDKALRSKAIIAVAASCLEKIQPRKETDIQPQRTEKKQQKRPASNER